MDFIWEVAFHKRVTVAWFSAESFFTFFIVYITDFQVFATIDSQFPVTFDLFLIARLHWQISNKMFRFLVSLPKPLYGIKK